MMRRIVVAGAICVSVLAASSLSAQRGNQSDATGSMTGLFSRGFVRAFAAPPAPPPVLIITPGLLDALCLERADALLTFATLSATAVDNAERNVLALMKGGPAATEVARALFSKMVLTGASSGQTDALLAALNGLLSPGRPDVPNVSAAVEAYNDIVRWAPLSFLAQPPAEFSATRLALGRLSAAANSAVEAERVYPGLEGAKLAYANDAPWLFTGEAIQVAGATYFQFGVQIPIADRQLKRVGEYGGVWVLAEEPVTEPPRTVFVPIRTYCDVELVPYALQERVIKRQNTRILW